MRLMFERDLTPHPQYCAFYEWLWQQQGQQGQQGQGQGQFSQQQQMQQQAQQAQMQAQMRPPMACVFVSGFKLEISGHEIDSDEP